MEVAQLPKEKEAKLRKVSKLQALIAVLAAVTMVMAAFVAPVAAKGGKGSGKGKKATIVSWDEATRTLVLTNKKAYEQTFTVAADAKLTKVVPCEDDDSTDDGTTEDDSDDSTKTCGNMEATTADLVTGYRVLNWKAKDGVVSRLKVKVPHAEEPAEEGTDDDGSEDDGSDDADPVTDCDDPATTDVVEACP